jgi:hypothetical protein
MVRLAKIIQYILVALTCIYVAIGIFMIVVGFLAPSPLDISYIVDVIIDEGKFVLGFGILAILVKVLRNNLENQKEVN